MQCSINLRLSISNIIIIIIIINPLFNKGIIITSLYDN